ncbi:MAG TPA: NAD(P)/FAD-dependent oxidoreductase [Thermomicrobiales bacterium]|jgi:2-polyprenyl-6-methoxyphenol hydroxylase-like FAD-dependent oxidoreductase
MERLPAAEYDVLIIGARVAGASLALLLGQRGHRVLLVDRDHFPSDTLSTHYMGPMVVPLLARLGVLGDVEAAGFRRLTRCRTYVGDCLFEGPVAPGGGYALAPRRDSLDMTLIEHAARHDSVTFRERTRVDGLLLEGDRVVGARLMTAGEAAREVRARVVIGADGKFSKVAEWVGAARYQEVPALRPAYYGYYRGLAALPEPTVEFFFVGERIGFVFPMQPGVDCLALELQPEDFATFRADPQATFEAHFRALPGMAVRLRGATLEGQMQGCQGIANHFRQPYGPGWALTGDAGYLKDPSTGAGIGDALNQSFWLADALDATLRGADWEASLGEFKRRRDETLLPAYRATLQFTQQRDTPGEDLAWLRAALCAPPFVRMLANGLPAVLPGAFPEPVRPTIARLAQAFGAAPVAETPIPA